MLTINIIFVGKKLEKYSELAISKFTTKIARFGVIKFHKIKPQVHGSIKSNLKKEAILILKHMQKGLNIVCDRKGEMISSSVFSSKIKQWQNQNSILNFVIGSSDGLDESVKIQADYNISFSPLTFPHELFQVLLLEQIYRSLTILNNHKYHK